MISPSLTAVPPVDRPQGRVLCSRANSLSKGDEMDKWNVLVTVPDPLRSLILTEDGLRKLRAFAQVTMNHDERNWTAQEIADWLPGMEAMITGWGIVPLTADVLARADRLRIIAHAAGSVKGFVSAEVYERGIQVTHAAGRIADSVAEFVLLMALLGLRQAHVYDRQMKTGVAWPKDRGQALCEISGKVVGVLGFGYVGRRAAQLFRAVGAEVWVYDPYLSEDGAGAAGMHKAELDALLAGCQVISLHLPVTNETHHLLGARELALVQDGAVLINTARAWVVDQQALVAELRTGRFWAALDVFDPEPLPPDHPLRGLDNVLLTPHVAGQTRDAYSALMATMIDEVARAYRGEPLKHQVTADMLAIMA